MKSIVATLLVLFVFGSHECNGQSSCFAVGSDYLYNDIQSLSTQNANECQLACAATPSCLFFSFSQSMKSCWLKSALGTPFTNPDRIFGPKYCTDSCFLVGTAYSGGDIQTFTLQTAKDCQGACASVANCQFFAFSPSLKSCWLKSSIGIATNNPDRIVGPKYCADPCYVVGSDYPGNDIQNLTTQTANSCQSACSNLINCQFFAFSPTLKICWLKSSIGVANTNIDRVVGPKYCNENRCPLGWLGEESYCWRYTPTCQLSTCLRNCYGENDQDITSKRGPAMIRLGQLLRLIQKPLTLRKLSAKKFIIDAKRTNANTWMESSTGSVINFNNYPEFSAKLNILPSASGTVIVADLSAVTIAGSASQVQFSSTNEIDSTLPSVCIRKLFGATPCNGDPFNTECHDQGTCINGFCKCFPGFAGKSCNIKGLQCPGNDCGQFGECNYQTGQCSCPSPLTLSSAGDSCVYAKATCGLTSTNRIVGGSNVSVPHTIPWTVMVIDSERKLLCGGTVIDFLHILTAAECTVGKSPSNFFIVHSAQDFNLTSSTDGKIIQGVSEIINHPDYNPSNSNNNFAILRLGIPITFSANVTPACLPKDNTLDYTGYTSVSSGWGTTIENDTSAVSDALKSVVLTILNNDECNNDYKFTVPPQTVTPQMLCAAASTPGQDSCDGDNGGPLTVKVGAVNYLVGVVSHGLGCGRNGFPGVYSRVSTALDWIRSNSYVNLCSPQ